ncbi:MAG: glutathione S-transferase [Motiliproteus sp.]|jgi:glutathione S-transferase
MKARLPILYTFRRCPYAIRARLAIAYSGQAIVWREVLLKEKPAELLRLSPKATVPVLQLVDGRIIDESLDIMRWALALGDQKGWLAKEPDRQALILALIQENDIQFKPSLDRYKYADRNPEFSAEEYRQQGEQFLAHLERRLTQTPYLAGATKTLADAAIFPFIRQFASVDPEWFQEAPYPRVRGWLQRWLASELFQEVMPKHPPWREGDEPRVFP